MSDVRLLIDRKLPHHHPWEPLRLTLNGIPNSIKFLDERGVLYWFVWEYTHYVNFYLVLPDTEAALLLTFYPETIVDD